MPGLLNRSPAHIIQQMLIDMSLASAPVSSPTPAGACSTDWPAYVGDEPARPDDAITIYDTRGLDFGDDMQGEKMGTYGIQARVRSKSYTNGYEKAHILAIACDGVNHRVVRVGAQRYKVWSITRSGDVLQLRTERELKSNNKVFVFNALASIRKVSI